MNLDRKLLLQLFIPLVAAFIPLGLWYFVNLKPSLTKQEKTLMVFSPKPVTVSRPGAQSVSGIDCPVRPSATDTVAAPKSYPPIPLDAMAPRGDDSGAKKPTPPKPSFHLSLVLMDETRKMVIINGRVLKEGEKLGIYRVALIEKDKVKLKGKQGELWVNVE